MPASSGWLAVAASPVAPLIPCSVRFRDPLWVQSSRHPRLSLAVAPCNSAVSLNVSVVVEAINATEVASSSYFSCAVQRQGSLSCQGQQSNGVLGDAAATPLYTSPNQASPSAAPAYRGAPSLPEPVSRVTTGSDHACAVLSSGASLQCWGASFYGQTGLGTYASVDTPTAVLVRAPVASKALAAGHRVLVALAA